MTSVYESTFPEIRPVERVNPPAQTAFSGDLLRAMEDLSDTESLLSLPRLYHTRVEANAIHSLVSKKQSLRALDFAANRATATSPELGQYRIVHFDACIR